MSKPIKKIREQINKLLKRLIIIVMLTLWENGQHLPISERSVDYGYLLLFSIQRMTLTISQ